MIAIDLKTLTREYLFAGTPGHVYRRFRENESLVNLARDAKPESLVGEYEKRIGKVARSIEDVVVAYAILIAITFFDYGEALRTFEKVDVSKLVWGKDVKDIYMREAKITSLATAAGEAMVREVEETKSETSNTYVQTRNTP